MTPKEHAILLLAQGIPTSQVAAACGVDDSYISQLKADPEVQDRIRESQAAASVADITFDETLEQAESLALEKIKRNLPLANMGQALAAFKILNSARRRSDPATRADPTIAVTVNLTLPQIAVPKYVTNSANEIVEVDGRVMLSATAKNLEAILASKGKALQAPNPQLTRAAEMLDRLSVPAALVPVSRRAPRLISPDVL